MRGKGSWTRGQAWRGLVAVSAVLLALLSTVPGLAQSGPNSMNFQGRLLDSSGNPLSGVTRCMEFNICTDGSSHLACVGTNVWGPEYKAVTTGSGTYKAGLFTVVLGGSTSLPPNLFYDHDTLYLEIGVSDQTMFCGSATYTPMEPRSELKASAFAQRSRRVRTYEADDDYLVHVSNIGTGGGVYARSVSGWGVYSDGDAHVEGSLTWMPTTSHVAISAADFQPSENGYDYFNVGYRLLLREAEVRSFVAQVDLPHGATVTSLTLHWYDDGDPLDIGVLTLFRAEPSQGTTELPDSMAWIAFTREGVDPGPHTSSTSSISYATVDNSQYVYYLDLGMVPGNEIYGVNIAYTIDHPH